MTTSTTTPINAVFLQGGEEMHPPATTSTTGSSGSIDLVAERDVDELEGTLLPVATQVHVVVDNTETTPSTFINNNDYAMAAVPVQYFEYDDALAKEEQDELQQQLRQPLLQQQQQESTGDDEIAYAIPYVAAAGHQHHINNPTDKSSSIADDSQVAVKYAQYAGYIRAEQEREAIRQANRKVYAQNYWEAQSVDTANVVAKIRDREGLQIQDDHLQSTLDNCNNNNNNNNNSKDRNETGCNDESSKQPPAATRKQNGYQIQQYDIADDYETSQYDVEQYKSIYD
jgi:hypothetical protein